MPITLEEVRHVAKLARLDLDEVEVLSLQGELNALLGHFEEIREIDLSGESAKPGSALRNVWDDDVPVKGLGQSAALQNAPSSKAGLFLVPSIIED